MPLPYLPPEIIHHIVSQAAPPDGWGKYWPERRAVHHVRLFLALRLVCREFNKLILDYFSEQPVLIEDFDSAVLQRSDPPTPAAVRFCRRLLTRHIERTRAGVRVNAAALAFAREMIGIVDAAVGVLTEGGQGQDGGVGVEGLREEYTRGLVTAVVGFSGVSRVVLEGVAGMERDAEEGDEVDFSDDEDEDGMEESDEDEDEDDKPTKRKPPARDGAQQKQYNLNVALTIAAVLGRIEDMEILTAKGVDIKFDGQDGWFGSSLHGAAIGGSQDAIDFYVQNAGGRNPSLDVECRRTGNTPLHFAAQNGHFDVVDWLLSVEAEPDEINEKAQRPLFLAASSGHADIVKRFLGVEDEPKKTRLELGIDDGFPESSDSDFSGGDDDDDDDYTRPPFVEADADEYRGRTPMLMAVQRGYLAVVEELMWRGDLDINRRNGEEYNMSYLATAASKGYEDIFRHLLSHIAINRDIKDSSGHRMLKHAAAGGNENIVREVLSWPNVDVNLRGADDSTPIMWAALHGYEPVVKLLIEHSAAVDLVSSQIHLKMMRLMREDPSPDGDGDGNGNGNPLPDPQVLAAMMGQIAVLVGASALDAAVHGGHEGIVKLLLAQPGVEVDRRDLDGRTPLANAALTAHAGVFKILLALGDRVDPEAADERGWTPLIHAVRSGEEEIVRVLLQDPRVDVNRKDKEGMGGLVHAVKRGAEGVMRLLLKVTLSKRDVEQALSCSMAYEPDNMQALLNSHLHTMSKKSQEMQM
ncbi:ankyrin [Aspergillus pseudoustus]|uniref:Ankyrin n=1 Tax=Aspergillus pseudoustus TaxID=1810923 RepID=A0ABR4KM05_9EURO